MRWNKVVVFVIMVIVVVVVLRRRWSVEYLIDRRHYEVSFGGLILGREWRWSLIVQIGRRYECCDTIKLPAF